MLVLLNVGAIFMGTALTIRDLIGERAIFRREQAVGLSTTAYLLAKVCIYAVFAIVQSGNRHGHHADRQGRADAEGGLILGTSETAASIELFIVMAADHRLRGDGGPGAVRAGRSPTNRSCRCWWSRS